VSGGIGFGDGGKTVTFNGINGRAVTEIDGFLHEGSEFAIAEPFGIFGVIAIGAAVDDLAYGNGGIEVDSVRIIGMLARRFGVGVGIGAGSGFALQGGIVSEGDEGQLQAGTSIASSFQSGHATFAQAVFATENRLGR